MVRAALLGFLASVFVALAIFVGGGSDVGSRRVWPGLCVVFAYFAFEAARAALRAFRARRTAR
jgi:hypothetical protein